MTEQFNAAVFAFQVSTNCLFIVRLYYLYIHLWGDKMTLFFFYTVVYVSSSGDEIGWVGETQRSVQLLSRYAMSLYIFKETEWGR